MTLTYRTVTGTYINPDGTPKRGTIEFSPTSSLIERPGAHISQTTMVVHLDATGSFSVELLCTDIANIEPVGWLWFVDEKIENGSNWYLEIETSASPLDISSVYIPNSQGAPITGIAGPMGPVGPGTPLVVLETGAPVPGGTPVGSVILRKVI
jgi:hypothetical protein